ncbi:MAG: TlpA disulfide reductase family protein [Alphaproteobacteria bacterium]|uniref:TlpA family protein disulfide reductase n=1 Tax=Pyruvatibacter sp. HU-CL02332 TaxID=3127650 RepID=UPI00296A1F3D|nr:TlpA disulfide reductase family protein [Alphaproteobacteria bacterium]
MAREKRPQKVSPKLRFQLAAFILAAGIAAVLYGMPFGGKLGDGTSEEPGTPAAIAGALKPYAVGAVQNFVAAREPLPLEAIEFVDGDGNPLTLADFTGRVVLLNLWATWCAPCREEMPALDALQAEAGSDDFLVLALSLDRGGIEKPKDFLEEIEIKHLALYHDKTGRMGTRLGAFGLPTTLLIGRDGKSLGRLVGPAHWDDPDAVALVRAAIAAGQADEAGAATAGG